VVASGARVGETNDNGSTSWKGHGPSAQLESGVGGLLGLYGNSGVGGAEMVLAGGVGISFSIFVPLLSLTLSLLLTEEFRLLICCCKLRNKWENCLVLF